MHRTLLILTTICFALPGSIELFAQVSENVEQVGRIFNQWHIAYDVTVVEDLAYVATGRSGLQIVDVSDSENPVILGYWDDNKERARGVVVSGDYAYIADCPDADDVWSESQYDNCGGGLYVLSIVDPTHPEELGYYETPGATLDIVVSGDYAYIAEDQIWVEGEHVTGGLRIISIIDPEHPEEVGYFEIGTGAFIVTVSGNYAYVTGQVGLHIISIADPESPEEIAFYETRDRPEGVGISGNYAYVSDYEGLHVLSIRDPEHPVELEFYDIYGLSGKITVSGNYIYVLEFACVIILSISDPEHPEELGLYLKQGQKYSITVSGDCAYITDRHGGLRIISIADQENPEEVGFYDPRRFDTEFVVCGDYLYIVKRDGLRIISITNPEFPREVGFYPIAKSVVYVRVVGDMMYIIRRNSSNDTNRLHVYSVANPLYFEELGYYDWSGGGICDFTVSGNYAYIPSWASLRVISIADPGFIEEVGVCNINRNVRDISVSGNYAYLTYCDSDDGGTTSTLMVISVADPEHPERNGSCTFSNDYNGWAMDIAVAGDYTYVADLIGLQVISVDDPENPEQVRSYNTPGCVQGITVAGDIAYIADGCNGLRIISMVDPENPEEVGYYHTPGKARQVALAKGGLICIDDGTNIGVYRFNDPSVYIPVKYNLLAAYPNPFNSSTTITYEMSHSGKISLQVYNPIGQPIYSLFDGFRQTGVHSTSLTANNLTSGLYFVRMETSGHVFSKKIQLVK